MNFRPVTDTPTGIFNMFRVSIVVDVYSEVDITHTFLSQDTLVDLQCEHGEDHHAEEREYDDFKQKAERLDQRSDDGLETCKRKSLQLKWHPLSSSANRDAKLTGNYGHSL